MKKVVGYQVLRKLDQACFSSCILLQNTIYEIKTTNWTLQLIDTMDNVSVLSENMVMESIIERSFALESVNKRNSMNGQ